MYAIKAHGVVEVYLHSFLTSALDEGKLLASCPSHFNPKKKPLVPTEEEAK
jgi:hypothetical protein